MVYKFELNRNDYEKIVKYKTRKTINLGIRNKSSKSRKQSRSKELDC